MKQRTSIYTYLFTFIFICIFGTCLCTKPSVVPTLSERVEHIIVLMLENRAFDHMLGSLHQINPNIDGLTGRETNPYNPLQPNSPLAHIAQTAPDITSVDPDHSVSGTRRQIYAFAPNTTHPTMNGFVYDYYLNGDTTSNGTDIMRVFNSTSLPVLSQLALQYVTFDHWFSSIPGPTQPNRMFFHSATSHGATEDDRERLALGYPQRTLFDNIWDSDLSWTDYYYDFPTILFLENLRSPEYVFNYKLIADLYDDLSAGTLANYSFIEPRWFDFLDYLATDQHPPHSVQLGEYLIADIYNHLIKSPKFNKTLFIITYDEHGGFYDHVTPPQHDIPPPDDIKPPADNPPFSFDRLGVRVPMVMISPWLVKGKVEKEQYEHSSFAATVKKMWNLKGGFLSKRDAWASTFEEVLMERDEARGFDDIQEVHVRADLQADFESWKQSESRTHEAYHQPGSKGGKGGKGGKGELSGLQRDVIAMARGVIGEKRKVEEELKTEEEGAEYCLKAVEEWRRRTIQEYKLEK